MAKMHLEEVMWDAVDVGATVLGGVTYSTVNGALDKVSFLSSNSTVNPAGYKNGKYIKTLLMAGIGIGAKVGGSYIEEHHNETLGKAIDAVGDWAAGTGAAIYAADPVISSYPARSAGVPAGQAPRQIVVRSGNIIS